MSPASPDTSADKTVLIVDDDKDVRLFLASLITSCGYHSISADNRNDGFKKAESENPDCIILNCLMCGEDGLALYQNIKTHEKLKNIPVVMLSAIDKDIMMQHWMFRRGGWAGAMAEPDAFCPSPPEAGTIVSLVRQLTGGPTPTQPNGDAS